MSRVLLISLAALAIVLALVFQVPILYLLLAAVVVGGVGAFLYLRPRTHVRKVSTYAPPRRDELADLGIIEIRPKMQVSSVPGSRHGLLSGSDGSNGTVVPQPTTSRAVDRKPESDTTDAAGQPDPALPAEPLAGRSQVPSAERTTSLHTVATSDVKVDDEKSMRTARKGWTTYVQPQFEGRGVDTLLQALVEATSSTTAVALQQIRDSSRYRIIVLASRSADAREGGQFTTEVEYPMPARGKVDVLRVETGLDISLTRYYERPVDLRELAVVRLPARTAADLLVCDTVKESGFDAKARSIIARFGPTIGTILVDDGATTLPSAADEAPGRLLAAVQDEIEKARAQKRSLALALVYLHVDRELHNNEHVAALEQDLEESIRESVSQARVQRFGDLTFGVFLPGDINEVEDWAVSFQAALEEDHLPDRLLASIGVAMLRDRHASADDFRADAFAALEEAFESGACTILE